MVPPSSTSSSSTGCSPGPGRLGLVWGRVRQGRQAAEALLVPWGFSLVPKSFAAPRGLGRDPSGWLEGERGKRMREKVEAGGLEKGLGGAGIAERTTDLATKTRKT